MDHNQRRYCFDYGGKNNTSVIKSNASSNVLSLYLQQKTPIRGCLIKTCDRADLRKSQQRLHQPCTGTFARKETEERPALVRRRRRGKIRSDRSSGEYLSWDFKEVRGRDSDTPREAGAYVVIDSPRFV